MPASPDAHSNDCSVSLFMGKKYQPIESAFSKWQRMQVLGYTNRTDGFIVMATRLSGGLLQCWSRRLVKYKIACAKNTDNNSMHLWDSQLFV